MRGVTPFAFKGFDVLSWLPDGLLSRAGTWTTTQERMDAPSGAFAITAPAIYPVHTQTARYRCFTRADRATLWTWLSARLGRYGPFWCPTFQRDLDILTPGVGTWIVRAAGFAASFATDPHGAYLYAIAKGGTNAVAVLVTAVADNGDGTETITFSTNVLNLGGNGGTLGIVETLETVTAASLLRFSRLDTDAITQTFATPEIVDLTFASASITGAQP